MIRAHSFDQRWSACRGYRRSGWTGRARISGRRAQGANLRHADPARTPVWSGYRLLIRCPDHASRLTKETAVNTRFKGLAKALAEEPSRREALRRIGGGLVTALLAYLGLQKSAWGQGSDIRDEMRRCVLCGKPQEQVAKLILGLHGGVCVECVDLCHDVFNREIYGAED